MNKFTRTLEQSKSIKRFAQVERMSQNDIYEFYYECYCAYTDMFLERLRHGLSLRKVLSEYRHIPEFGALKPSQIGRIIFTSRKMAYWFAFMFWQAIDRQVISGSIDRDELQLELTFMGRIPSAKIMEDILYEQKTKKAAANSLFPEGYAGKAEGKKAEARVGINS